MCIYNLQGNVELVFGDLGSGISFWAVQSANFLYKGVLCTILDILSFGWVKWRTWKCMGTQSYHHRTKSHKVLTASWDQVIVLNIWCTCWHLYYGWRKRRNSWLGHLDPACVISFWWANCIKFSFPLLKQSFVLAKLLNSSCITAHVSGQWSQCREVSCTPLLIRLQGLLYRCR